jgi:opacity protein-like surface antigen
MLRSTGAFLVALVSLSTLHAENLFEFSVAGGPALPVRGLKALVGTGYAGSGEMAIFLNDNISVFAHGDYARWQFSSQKVNASVAAAGGQPGYSVSGPFRAILVTIGGRLTFDGASVRPYFGISGGAGFLHRKFTALGAPAGSSVTSGDFTCTWTEPAISVDAGLKFVLSTRMTLDLGGRYSAFSNADDMIEPREFLGTPVTGLNTASFVGVQAGLSVGF